MALAKTSLEQWAVLAAVVDQGGFAQAAAALNRSNRQSVTRWRGCRRRWLCPCSLSRAARQS